MTVVQAMQPVQKRWLIVFLGAYSSAIVTLLASLVAAS
jgi:hypothetical protein